MLGHCTGRLLSGRGRPQSEFDAGAVFSAGRDRGVVGEINCRRTRAKLFGIGPDRAINTRRTSAMTGRID